MAPKYLTDSERPYRDITIQDKFRFWLEFKLRDYVYKRWFASAFERDNYRNYQIPGGVVLDYGEQPFRPDYRGLENG